MTIAVIAEKPSVGRDLAKVLGATKQGQGFLHGNGYVVSWAVGHLVTIAEPHVMNESWKRWRLSDLPMVPPDWKLAVYDKLQDQFEVVKKILNSEQVEEVICATDAGREGELIFRYIYETTGCTKPLKRLWISSLTPEAISEGFKKLRPASDFDNLADAARGRSRADWLVGLNLSRLYSLRSGESFSVGRVQTPTLAMVVEREWAIFNFVPEDYQELHLTLLPPDETLEPFPGVVVDPPEAPKAVEGTSATAVALPSWASAKSKRFPKDDPTIEGLRSGLSSKSGVVHWQQAKTNRIPPPQFFDLTELQRTANRLFGFSAQDVLGFAQALYEKHKLITYPRTDSKHLSQDMVAHLPKTINAMRQAYKDLCLPNMDPKSLGRRFVDDAQVTDHHAIIPTPVVPRLEFLADGERKVYDLVARRLIGAWYPDYVVDVSSVVTRFAGVATGDAIFALSSGSVIRDDGWKAVEAKFGAGKEAKPKRKSKKAADEAGGAEKPLAATDTALPKGLVEGAAVKIIKAAINAKATRPPQRLNDATLLSAMESAGRSLSDKRLSDAMRERGLGTPATRASIIEVLIDRQYMYREGKALHATDKGAKLIEIVDDAVKSPEMTGAWEARLKDMEKGKDSFASFMKDVENYVRDVLGRSPKGPGSPQPAPVQRAEVGPARRAEVTPVKRSPEAILEQRFGHKKFLPFQREAIDAALAGKDVLLVMPTGAGKSLCYQLPALVGGHGAVVISPLVALMDDQVAKLCKLGIRARALHSGMTREQSRAVCIEYLQGVCEILYISPERLGVPGFPEMLAKRKLSVLAVDEAHCISQWGHDFRPDYRMIRERLAKIQAPVMAVTATATGDVRQDILAQLPRSHWQEHVHGFWRPNLALTCAPTPPKERLNAAMALLAEPARLPAIVYMPSRKLAEEWAQALGRVAPTGVYHAGLDSETRHTTQDKFLRGELSIMVATIAFGMGVDKADIRTVVHGAMPASVEAYYQEVGRAGRDGKPSVCTLYWSREDLRTHEYHLGRDYAPIEVLEKIVAAVQDGPRNRMELLSVSRLEEENFDRALDKLWLHGALTVLGDDRFGKGRLGWVSDLVAQRDARLSRLQHMVDLCKSEFCRMAQVVSYFGDTGEARCGHCDNCVSGSDQLGSKRPKSSSKAIMDEASGDQVMTEAQRDRLNVLRDWRRKCSEEEGLPPYRILNNATMEELARRGPTAPNELSDIKGLGPKLIKRYGTTIVGLLNTKIAPQSMKDQSR